MKKNSKRTLIIFSILFFIAAGCVFFAEQEDLSQLSEKELFFQEITEEKEESPSQPEKEEEEQIEPEKTPPVPVASFKILLSATQLKQGDTLIVTAENAPAGEKITGKFDDKEFDFFSIGETEKQIGIVGIDAKKEPGNYNIAVSFPDSEIIKKTITVKKSNFPVTEIAISPELKEQGYTPATIAENISTTDGVLINEVLQKYTSEIYFNKAFSYPLKTLEDVGAYGNIRKEGDITIQHLGVDLDASTGTPVYAVNDGLVVFIKELTVFGKTIIIDHGLGIYSLYLHLSEFKVGKGERVVRGKIIGLSGNTGWSNGPHLHFSIKLNGASVDPLKFIETIKNID